MHIEPLELTLELLLGYIDIETAQSETCVGMYGMGLERLELRLDAGKLLAIEVELGRQIHDKRPEAMHLIAVCERHD